MEKNIKRYTVTTALEYDKEGDVVREERCEDTEYYDPTTAPKPVIVAKSNDKELKDLMACI